MATHRMLLTVAIVAAFSFLAATFLATPVFAAGNAQTKAKVRTIHAKVHDGSKKVVNRIPSNKPVQATQTANANKSPDTVCYAGPTGTTCYYGCVPYYNAPASGWNVPAASGRVSATAGQSKPAQTGSGTRTTVCHNTWTPVGGVTSYTWYVPATSGQPPIRTSGPPAAQQAALASPAVVCPQIPLTQSNTPGTSSSTNSCSDWIAWMSQPFQVVYEWVRPTCW